MDISITLDIILLYVEHTADLWTDKINILAEAGVAQADRSFSPVYLSEVNHIAKYFPFSLFLFFFFFYYLQNSIGVMQLG